MAQAWCDTLAARGVPPEAVNLKSRWIKEVYSANHVFGVSVYGGPLLYGHQTIQDKSGIYSYDAGRYSEGELWFTLNQRQTFTFGIAHFGASFQERQPDSLWYGIDYTDTLYASLGQRPATNQYLQTEIINSFGETDTLYNDYTETFLGELKIRPDPGSFEFLAATPQAPYRPKAIVQNQVRMAWSNLFAKWSLGAALTLGQSNIPGQKRFTNIWVKQGISLPWLDLVLQESVLKLDKALFAQISPQLIRAQWGLLWHLEPTFIRLAQADSHLRVAKGQVSLDGKVSKRFSRFSLAVNGSWGRKAYGGFLEGRSIGTLEMDHRMSYGLTATYWPFRGPFNQYLHFYTIIKGEEYSGLTRSIAFLGAAYSW